MQNAETLMGLRVLVTRASHQSGSFSEKLQRLGASVVEMPLIVIAPPDSWEDVDEELKQIDQYDWIVFASANAVTSFFDRASQIEINAATSSAKFAAVGPGTADVLKLRGVTPDYQASEYVAEGLVHQFPGYPHLQRINVLWPKTNIGRTYLRDALQAAGATVRPVVCYKTEAPSNMPELGQQLDRLLNTEEIDAITVTSSEAASNLAKLLKHHTQDSGAASQFLQKIEFISIGPQTSKTLKELMGEAVRVHQPQEFNIDGMVALLEQIWSSRTVALKKTPKGHDV